MGISSNPTQRMSIDIQFVDLENRKVLGKDIMGAEVYAFIKPSINKSQYFPQIGERWIAEKPQNDIYWELEERAIISNPNFEDTYDDLAGREMLGDREIHFENEAKILYVKTGEEIKLPLGWEILREEDVFGGRLITII